MVVLRLAWRETRAHASRLVFFFVCVALGVASIVALRSVIQHVRLTMAREARQILGADLVIQSPRALTPDIDATVTRLVGAAAATRVDVIQTLTMAQSTAPAAVPRLVELRGVSAGYPHYGTLTLASGRPWSAARVAGHGVVVPPEVIAQLGVAVGDRLLIAGTAFEIRDVVTAERVQRAGGLAFGPRVYVDVADLRALPVLGVGARATWQRLYRVPDSEPGAALDALTARLKAALAGVTVTAQSWRTLGDRLGTALGTGENYLSLVGFAIVVLGGIGVWSVTRVFVQQKLRTIAVLKCVGASSAQVLATYLVQMTGLTLAGCALGVALAAVALAAVPTGVLAALGVTTVGVTASAAAQGIGVGLLVSLLFALVPLLEVRAVKPLLLLRADTASTTRRPDRWSVGAGVLLALGVAGLAVWQAGSPRAGLYVTGGLVVVAGALALAGRALVGLVRPLSRSRRFALRHAILRVGRPGNQTRVIVTAVGLGAFFILGMQAVERNVLTAFAVETGAGTPDLVLIDVQQDQADGVRALVARHTTRPPRVVPMLRGRVVGVTGARATLATAADVREEGDLARDYGITYRATLEDNERLVAGTFWREPLPAGGTPEGFETEVSIEQSLHDRHGLDLGDEIRFDLSGRVIRARVTSIRKVTWDNTQNGGFMFVFRPGPIERAPHALLAFVGGLAAPEARAGLQRELAAAYPNVSVIDVRDVLRTVSDVLGQVTLGVSIVGGVLLVSGVLILIGAVAMTKFQRVYDAAIYRTLGATTARLAAMVVVEYGALGLLAGLTGAAGAAGLSWAVSRWLLDIAWQPHAGWLAGGVVATAALVAVVGVAASADVLVRKPLRTLRG